MKEGPCVENMPNEEPNWLTFQLTVGTVCIVKHKKHCSILSILNPLMMVGSRLR